MTLNMLKGKLHRAVVTASDLDYEGSIGVDSGLLDAAGILPFEEVQVWNVTNGARFATYAIEAPSGTGQIQVNGSAARMVQVGDLLIIAAFAHMSVEEARHHTPRVVLLDAKNQKK